MNESKRVEVRGFKAQGIDASGALEAYIEQYGNIIPADQLNDDHLQSYLVWLLTDLRHMAQERGWQWHTLAAEAQDQFANECEVMRIAREEGGVGASSSS